MFDLTDIKPETPQFKPVKQQSQQQSQVQEEEVTNPQDKLQQIKEDFDSVLMSDPASATAIRFQDKLKRNREDLGHIPRYEVDNFSGLRGKFNAEMADEIYARDKAAGLIPETEDEFIRD